MVLLRVFFAALFLVCGLASTQTTMYRAGPIASGDAVIGGSGTSTNMGADAGYPPALLSPNVYPLGYLNQYPLHMTRGYYNNHAPLLTFGTGVQESSIAGNIDLADECYGISATPPVVCNSVFAEVAEYIPYYWSQSLGLYLQPANQPSLIQRYSACPVRSDFLGQSLTFLTAVNSVAAGGTGYLKGDLLFAAGGTLGNLPGPTAGSTNQVYAEVVVSDNSTHSTTSPGAVTAAAVYIMGGYTTAPTNPVTFYPSNHVVAISNATAGTGNVILLTVATTAAFSTGEGLTVSGVQGVPAANGTFNGTLVDSTHISLNGTTFSGSYVPSTGAQAIWTGAGSGAELNVTFAAHCPPLPGTNAGTIQFAVDDQYGNPNVDVADLFAGTDKQGPAITPANAAGDFTVATANTGQRITGLEFIGTPTSGETVLTYVSTWNQMSLFNPLVIAETSTITAGTAATQITAFSILQNGSPVGSITFNPADGSGGTNGVPTIFGPYIVVNPGDTITVVAPSVVTGAPGNIDFCILVSSTCTGGLGPTAFPLTGAEVDSNQDLIYWNNIRFGNGRTLLADNNRNIYGNVLNGNALNLTSAISTPQIGGGEAYGAVVREVSATNLLLQTTYSGSSGICTSPWTLTSATCASSTQLSPDGTADAAVLTASATSGKILQNMTISADSTSYYACSVYLANLGSATPATEWSIRETVITGGTTEFASLIYTPSTGNATPSTVGMPYAITPDPSGIWTRLSTFLQNAGNTTLRMEVFPAASVSGGGGALVWNPQCEAMTPVAKNATSADTPSGAVLPLYSAQGIKAGWIVAGTNIPAGDTVLSISGSNVTLVTAPTGDVAANTALSFYRPQPTGPIPTVASTVTRIAGGQYLSTPASSSEPCYQGQTKFDATYNYLCSPANTWTRVSRSSF